MAPVPGRWNFGTCDEDATEAVAPLDNLSGVEASSLKPETSELQTLSFYQPPVKLFRFDAAADLNRKSTDAERWVLLPGGDPQCGDLRAKQMAALDVGKDEVSRVRDLGLALRFCF